MARRRVPFLAQATAECEAEPQRDPGKGMSIREPEDVQAWATESGLVSRRYEEPWVLVLDRQSRLMHARRVACGGPGGTHLELSDVIDAARNPSSPGFILVHNHPSGNPQPNKLDVKTTQELIELTKTHGMRLLDHVVVCPSRFMSMKNEGLLAA